MLPKVMELEFDIQQDELTSPPMGKSFLFDFRTGDFVLRDGKPVLADETTALRIWIEKAIRTELDRYAIYEGTGYGIQTEDLIGKSLPYSFVESELRRELTETLTQHPRIQGITDIEMSRDKSWLVVNLRVLLIDSTTFGQEVRFEDVRG